MYITCMYIITCMFQIKTDKRKQFRKFLFKVPDTKIK